MAATPPPRPVSLGIWVLRWLGGVDSLRLTYSSVESHVSVRESRSILRSVIRSLTRATLEDRYLILRRPHLICLGYCIFLRPGRERPMALLIWLDFRFSSLAFSYSSSPMDFLVITSCSGLVLLLITGTLCCNIGDVHFFFSGIVFFLFAKGMGQCYDMSMHQVTTFGKLHVTAQ